MSAKFTKQYRGVAVLKMGPAGIGVAAGTTVPSGGALGYAPGCWFLDLDAGAGAQWYRNDGTKASASFVQVTGGVNLAGLTATADELNRLDDGNAVLATTAGPGITGGVGTVIKTSVFKAGDIIHTEIFIDVAGLNGGGTADDIIGTNGAGAAYLGQITAARNGTIFGGTVTCLEVATTSDPDIDLWSANEATGVEDSAISALTGEVQLTNGGDHTLGRTIALIALPVANQYLYLTGGDATAGTYDAGQLLIRLYGA